MSGISLTYDIRVSTGIGLEYVWYITELSFRVSLVIFMEYPCHMFLSAQRPAAAMRLGCGCTRILGVKGVYCYSAKRGWQPGRQRPSGRRCSPMWLSITGMTDCDGFNVVAAATPEKHHDDVHIELAPCIVRK